MLPDPAKLKDVVTGSGDVAKNLAAGAVVRDPTRAVYRYHQVFPDPAATRVLTRKMLICATRLEAWTEALIRATEATVPAAKDAQLAQLKATRIQAQPVLAGFRDAAGEVDRLFRRVEGERPTLELTTADQTTHRLWRVQSAELLGQLRHHLAPKKLVVLDGHDRYEALVAYRDELGAKQPLAQYASPNYGLTCLVGLDDPTLIVAPRPRVLRGAGTSAAALAAARSHFIVEKLAGAAKDVAKQRAALADTVAHQPAFVIAWATEPDAWKLTLSPDASPTAAGVQVHRAMQRLDPVVVDKLFIERMVPGAKLETAASAEDALAAKGDATILLRPLTVEQIHHVTELGQTLPAGSIAILPRQAPNLVAAVIDPDEDLQ